ncbi:glucosaminidase domain-containing protein [Polaribacter sp. HL-MS24]|uniref:glucosaminidase domain-containing protein n=1 Tax=Polaribacter sp. HL-MS24 TaxID=3077735 RepID=UPI002934DED0|nr:glucosaminidase domain-containing protein [Polaribacter sp. HL-MS24]WOC39310.1 glucosaminidase domain-containing protein [Polaribacter sp. HL-MS24]
MTIRILFIFLFSLLFVSCGSKKTVVRKPSRIVVVEPKPEKIPSVNQAKHIRNLQRSSTTLNTDVLQYIRKYAPIAVHEMHTSKIPASITLAQGILESGSGKSLLARKSNNHFGIKCHKNWKGERVYHDDDEKGECFRKYTYVESSYKDHSAFLTQRRRYAFLFDYGTKDYKKWAKGLRKAGYATDKKYPQKLLKLIKTYQLFEFDSFKKRHFKTAKHSKKYLPKKKETKTYIVKKGDTLYAISKRFDISVAALKEQNNLKNNDLEIGKKLIIEH